MKVTLMSQSHFIYLQSSSSFFTSKFQHSVHKYLPVSPMFYPEFMLYRLMMVRSRWPSLQDPVPKASQL